MVVNGVQVLPLESVSAMAEKNPTAATRKLHPVVSIEEVVNVLVSVLPCPI